MIERRFLTPAEAAEELRVSSDTVLRLIADGRLPAIRVSSRIIRIPRPAFEIFREGREIPRRRVVTRPSEAEPKLGAGEDIPEREPA
jgi:excisionase family DNA binding protein